MYVHVNTKKEDLCVHLLLVAVETCLKKLVMVSVAGLKPVRLHDSSPLVVLSRERLPMMLEFLRSDHEPFLSAYMGEKCIYKPDSFFL